MLHRFCLLLVSISGSFILNAQTPQFDWVYTATNPGYCDADAIATDNLGHVYAAGNFYDSLNIGNTVLYSVGWSSVCVYIVKLDTLGNFIWVRPMTSGQCYVRDMKTDSYGNVFVMGVFAGTVTAGSYSITAGTSYLSSYIAKIDPNGNFLWLNKYSGNDKVEFYNMDLSSNGLIGVVGLFAGTITVGATSRTVFGQYDALILALDTSGNLVWMENDGGAYSDRAYGIEIDNQGNFYVCGGYGSYTHEAYFGGDTLMPVSGLDAFLEKYDVAGNFQWVRTGGGDWNSGSGWGDEALSVTIDVVGNIYEVGHFGDTAVFDSHVIIAPSGGVWQFVAKYDPNGNCLWVRAPSAISAPVLQMASSDIYCLNEDVIVCGSFYHNIIFANDTLVRSPSGTFDAYIGSIDTSGSNWRWGKSVSGTGPTGIRAYNIASDNASNIYIAGIGSGNSLFFDAYTIAPAYMDLYVTRISGDMLLGTENYPASGSVRVYPNPADEIMHVNLISGNRISGIKIFNVLGERIMCEAVAQSASAEINTAELSPGTYIVMVTSAEGEISSTLFQKN